jgi:hypothetical protein
MAAMDGIVGRENGQENDYGALTEAVSGVARMIGETSV